MKTAILILALVFTAELHADPVVKISGYVLSKTDAGLLVVHCRAEATGLYEYTSVLGAHKTVQEFTCAK